MQIVARNTHDKISVNVYIFCDSILTSIMEKTELKSYSMQSWYSVTRILTRTEAMALCSYSYRYS